MNSAQRLGYRGIIALVAIGFLFTAVEVRFLHLGPVRETWVAWIPTIASVLGVVGAALGLAASRGSRKFGVGLLVVVAVAGVAGVYFHTELKPGRFTKLFGNGEYAQSDSDRDKPAEPQKEEKDKDAGRKRDEDDGNAPPLAPLAMCGLGLIGALAIAARPNDG